MKTSRTQKTTERGSVMIVTMCVLGVSALVLGSYFMLVQNQSSAVARSQIFNSAVPVTEAGVEEALALININQGSPDDPNQMLWTNSATANGWGAFTNGVTTITRNVAGNNSYTVSIDITTVNFTNGIGPTITSSGNVPFYTVPFVFTGTIQPFLAQAQQNYSTSANMARKVGVGTVPMPLFTAAVITRSNFDMKGNNCAVDSFDSSMTVLFPGGIYNAVNRRSYGDLATDSSIVGDISLGNGNIYGHVMTGPGTQQSAVQIGPNGAVGDVVWQATHSGIESNYWTGDFNVNIPDVAAPTWSGAALPGVTNGVITLIGGNNYTTASDPGKPLVVKGPGTVKLWMQGTMSAGNGITMSNGGTMVLYLGTTNAGGSDSFGGAGQTAVNYPGVAQNLQIYGLPSLKTVTFAGNAGWAATLYAPEADVSGKGGGNNTLDSSGAMIVNSVTLNGHWNFHYDEHLKAAGPSRGWIANSWTEKKSGP